MVPRGQDCPNVLVTRNRQDIHRPLSESRSCEVSLNMNLDMDEDMLPTSPPPQLFDSNAKQNFVDARKFQYA